MNRVFLEKYDSSGKFPDGRIKLDVYFRDSAGNRYVWTPDWEQGTRNLFLEAYRIERLNKPAGPERERFKQTAAQVLSEEEERGAPVNFKLVAIKLGEELKYDTSVNAIRRAALALFDFDVSTHPQQSITSTRAQEIYDCVMTLAQQPMTAERKLQLLRDFVRALVPPDLSEALIAELLRAEGAS